MDNEIKELWRKFGLWYQNARENAGKTQEDIAKIAGIHVKTISRIENGEPTKRNTVLKLAEAVGLDKKEALNKAGFDVPSDSARKKPQTVAEFIEALESMGVTEWSIPGEDLNKLPPEAFAQLLDLIETNIRVQLKKVA